MNRLITSTHARALQGVSLIALMAITGWLLMSDWQALDAQNERLATLQAPSVETLVKEQPALKEEQPVPTLSVMPEVLEDMVALGAADGLTTDQMKLSLIQNENDQHYQISLTLKGPYPAIRKFVLNALQLRPGAQLDEITFIRQNATDPAVEVPMTFSFALKELF